MSLYPDEHDNDELFPVFYGPDEYEEECPEIDWDPSALDLLAAEVENSESYDEECFLVFEEVMEELTRIREKWGEGIPAGPDPENVNKRNGTNRELMDSLIPDLKKKYNEAMKNQLTWRDILEEEVMEVFEEPCTATARIKEELIQVIAVSVRWILDLHNQGLN